MVRQRRHIILIFMTLAMLGSIATSCRREPLSNERATLYIDLALDLLTRQQNTPIDTPTHHVVVFYDPKSHEELYNAYVETYGGDVSVRPGTYDIVTYNFGTEWTQIRNRELRTTAEAFTSFVPGAVEETRNLMVKLLEDQGAEGATRGTYSEEEVIYEPDHLLVGRKEKVSITGQAPHGEKEIVHLDCQTILETWSLQIGPLKGAQYIKECTVFLTGQARGNYYAYDDRIGPPTTIYFPIYIDELRQALFTQFDTFGKYPGAENKVYLNVFIIDGDGDPHVFEYDVTDQFDDPDNEIDHELIINNPDIDIPETSTGGFTADVDQWDPEITDIPIGD